MALAQPDPTEHHAAIPEAPDPQTPAPDKADLEKADPETSDPLRQWARDMAAKLPPMTDEEITSTAHILRRVDARRRADRSPRSTPGPDPPIPQQRATDTDATRPRTNGDRTRDRTRDQETERPTTASPVHDPT